MVEPIRQLTPATLLITRLSNTLSVRMHNGQANTSQADDRERQLRAKAPLSHCSLSPMSPRLSTLMRGPFGVSIADGHLRIRRIRRSVRIEPAALLDFIRAS